MHRLTAFLIICSFLLLTACAAPSIFKSRDRTKELTQKAIFKYLAQPNIFLDDLTGKGLTKLDPLLCLRETLSMNGTVYFEQPMRSDLLKYPLPKKACRLVIPDSLADKYRYVDEENTDYEHDYAIIHQFSPLLPTKEPNIYLMEYHIWANSCSDVGLVSPDCVRAVNRYYLRFRVENEKITVLDVLLLTNMIDFIGFGGFSRKKMEEALPGEKIIKSRH
ncbi:MAG: hypothetical protein Q7T20_13120 [Saprospiraceae bacterium]|nr:hypothetical protein [Saprospiraceae bacterium]